MTASPLGAPATVRVRVTGTPAPDDTGLVEVRDQLGKTMMARYDLRPKGVSQPATGETWMATRIGDVWVLDRMLAHPGPTAVAGSDTDPGGTLATLLAALAALGVVVDATVPVTTVQQLVQAAAGTVGTLTEWRNLANALVASMSTAGDLTLAGSLVIGGDLTMTHPPGHGEFYSGGIVTSTTSSSFVSVTGAVTGTIVKARAATRLRLDVRASFVASVGNTTWELAMFIGGADHPFGGGYFNLANDHKFVAVIAYIGGLAAGSYTAQLRWRRPTGTGTLAFDANDWISFDVDEVP